MLRNPIEISKLRNWYLNLNIQTTTKKNFMCDSCVFIFSQYKLSSNKAKWRFVSYQVLGRKVTLGCSAIVHKLHWRPSSIILDKVTLGQAWSWRWHWRLPSSSGYWMTFGVAAHLYLGKSVTEHGTYLSTPLHRLWTIQKSFAVSCRRSVHIFQLNLGMGTKALVDQD